MSIPPNSYTNTTKIRELEAKIARKCIQHAGIVIPPLSLSEGDLSTCNVDKINLKFPLITWNLQSYNCFGCSYVYLVLYSIRKLP